MDLDEQLIKKNKTKQYDMKIIESKAVNTLLIIKSCLEPNFTKKRLTRNDPIQPIE